MTSRFQNTGATLNNLWLTNLVPPSGFVYVPSSSTITLPGGVVVTGAAADPAIGPAGDSLTWDFSSVVTPSTVSNLLISEVFYDPTNTVEDAYEWIEIYNPATTSLTLNGWSIRDAAPGQVDTLPTFTIAPGEFVIIAASTSAFFAGHAGYTGQVVQVADGALGSGLNNFGDGIFLRNEVSANVDGMSYGASTAAFNPPVSLVAQGSSSVRNPANNDTNTRTDWSALASPNPGSGTIPVGIQNGGTLSVVWKAEVACDAISGQFLSHAHYEQPAGTLRTASVTRFVTISRPDLVVTKMPNLQAAGFGDLVTWTVRVENAGFGAAPNVTLTDNLGPGLVFDGFNINPTNAVIGSNVTWDASVIPAFTSLAAGAYVDLVVTAEVVSCAGLFNSADATWRCAGLLAATNATCENTAENGQTAVATLQFVDRYPSLSGSIFPTNLIVPYCGTVDVTLFLTNASGADIGVAKDMNVFAFVPDGWIYTFPTNIGALAPGQSTSIVVTVEAGGDCPLSLDPQAVVFYPYYFDACDQFFYGPVLFESAVVVNPPQASVSKQMPTAASTTFPVVVRFSYTNFAGAEAVTLTDVYPLASNLSVANISAGGVLISNRVIWTGLTPGAGSGVLTTRFDMVFLDPCGGPDTLAFNRIEASTYTDCQGCVREVAGSGQLYPIRLTRAPSCGTTGTGGCDYASVKVVSTGLTEVCEAATLTHTFQNFSGSTLTNWTDVTFTSDLAGGLGYLASTSSVQVLINGSNVTYAVSITQTNPSLVLNLAGLNSTVYSNLTTVTNGLAIRWGVAATTNGQMLDISSLTAPPCGTETEYALWNAGESRMTIALDEELFAEACGISYGRIEMDMLPLPLGTVGTNSLFPVYDVEVVLDMDADTNGISSFAYVTNSTTFLNLHDQSGVPLTPVDPAISSTQLVWSLGDLRTNQDMVITYELRATCDGDVAGQQRAYVRYNNRCADGTTPQDYDAHSATNSEPFFFQPDLSSAIEPELTFLVSTQLAIRLDFLNSGFGSVYNLRAEMLLPPNIVFGGAAIAPSFISSTSVVWDFQINSSFPGLNDLDGDGFYDDMFFSNPLSFWVTNYVTDCVGGSNITLFSSHGCLGSICATAAVDTATFVSSVGALITRATFPDIETLCATNPVTYSVRNSGLTVDYDVQAYQTLPQGITYVSGSSRVSLNNGPTNAIADPPGDGTATNPLTWTSGQIAELAAMDPNDQVTILYDVYLGCDATLGDYQFISDGRFTDNCGIIQSNRDVISVLAVNEPLLQVTKNSALEVADLNETNVYSIVISHDALSAANVPSMRLVDTLPAAVTFLGASPAPDAVIGQTLIWSNATLMALVGDGVSPFTIGEASVSIWVTGRVVGCDPSVVNSVVVNYGCSDTNQCLTATDDVNLITAPVLSPPGLTGTLQMNTCGGTKVVTVTNSGATAHGAFMTQTAPTGYIFVSASVTGEFNSAALTMVLGGSPVGRTATIDFTTAAASGATDVDDDRADGLGNLDFSMGDAFTITYLMSSDGTELDCLADPTDLDFADPDQLDPTSRSSAGSLSFTNLCGEAGVAAGTLSAFPDIPDPDIDLQPNSMILTNGSVATISATIRNNAESGNAENLHIRLRFGTGWTNVTLVSSNVISSGSSALTVEIQGSTNVLVDMPGVMLDPVDDSVVLNFEATATQNGGNLDVLAEVVGDCGDSSIIPACTFTNTLGQAPLANTMTGAVVSAVNGQYYGFDQDRFVGAGQSLSKTVRYDDEPAINAGFTRTARVGEDLIYRIEASYFGGVFSNITVTESLPAELLFRSPTNYAFSGAVTGATYDAGTGVFILQPSVLLSNPSSFAVEFPVVMSNRLDVQQGAVVTNVVVTDYFLDGVTNAPTPRSTEVPVLEPVLTLAKLVNSNLVQEGNVVIFTNILQHTAGSTTSAYDVVFTDTLPAGLTFSSLDLGTDGLDNDGDGAVDEPDEAGLVSGNTITVTTNNNAALYEVAVGDSVTFRFPALVQNQIVGATMTNRAFATYTSLDGVGTNGNERTGADGPGGLNDYTTNAAVTLSSLPVGAITKTFVSSSQTNTPDFASSNYFTIGERFVYEIRVDIPQGVATNVSITDSVPLLVDWVGGNTNAGLTYPGFGYQFIVPVGGPQFPTTTVEGLVITDTDPTPTSSTSADGSGSNVVFRFGAITNVADGILTNDFFLLRMEFVALTGGDGLGAIANQVTIRTNLVTVQDSFTNRTAAAPRFFFVEHNIGIAKTRSPATADAGDVVTFTLIVTNLQGGATGGNSSAYDIRVADTLLSNVYDVATLTPVTVPNGWDTTNTPVAGGVRYELFTTNTTALPVGARVTNIFTVALAQGVRPSQIYTNRADVTNSTTLYGPPPGGISERNDTANSSVNFTVPGLSLGKALFSTSEATSPPDSLTNSVQIGEVVTYLLTVTLPEATITNLTIVDVISSNGLAYVRGSALVVTNGFTNSTLGVLSESPTGSGLLATNGQAMTFVFTNLTIVANDNDTNNNSFGLQLSYLVLNTNLNSGLVPATVHTNRATLTYGGNPGPVVTSGVVNTYVTEPVLGIRKSMSPTNVQGGTVVSFTFVVTNSGSATAYDVVVSDPLNPGYFDTASISNAVVPTGFVFSVVSDTVFVRSDTNAVTGTNTLEVGESITITFDATAAVTFPPNARVTNLVGVVGDSLRSTNIFAVQRPTTSSAPAVIQGLDFNLVKTLFATSENDPVASTNDRVQIGEVATYQLAVQLPEGTTTNLTFTDTLPLGLSFIMGSVVVDTADLNGTVPPVLVTPDTAIEPAGNGLDITIAFPGNTIVTPDGETTNDILRIRFQVLVLDTNSNVGLAGSQTVLPNTASVTYDGNPNPPATSQVVNVTVIEPQPRITKDISPNVGDAGDQVVVTLTITNSGLAAAYDIALTDRVDGVFYEIASISNITAYTGWIFEVETNLPDVTVVYRVDNDFYSPPDTTLEPGEAMVFSFALNLAQTVVPNQIHTNHAGFREVNTILAGPPWEERSYTPPEGTDTVSVGNLSLAKSLTGTSETGPVDTTGTNVTIGEVATYRLVVTLPESTITNLTVADNLPVGMTFFTNVFVDTTGFGGSLPSLTPDVLNMGGSGGDVTFTFNGYTVVTNDNNPANNSFAIEFNALVLNVVGNDGLPTAVDGDGFTILTNRATLTYDGNPSNPVPSGVVNVRVVEPSLLIGKTMTPPTNGVVLMTLVVTNRGAATAFDVVVTDLVRTVWFDTSTLSPVTVPTGFTYAAVGAPGNATVTFASDPASGQPTKSIEVGEAVTFQFSASLIPGASGRITNTAVVATNTTTDGPNPDERVEPPATNTALLELPSFTVTKTRTSPVGRPADVGETVTFRLTVTNTGPVGFSTVALEDSFDNVVLAFSSATPAETSVAGGLITWANVGPLPVGRATNVLVSFTALQSTLPGDTTNWVVASLITTNGGPLPPQTSSAPVAVAVPSYVLNKELLDPVAGVATQGQAVIFRLSVTNDGEVGLNPVRLDDTFDASILTFVSATPTQDSSGVGSLAWTNVGPLGVGETSVVTVRFTAASNTWPFDTTNLVVSTVSTTNNTPLPPQTSSVPVEVANPQIGLTKLAAAAPDGDIWFTNAGSDVVYSYVITNRGTTHLITMTVTDNVLGVIGTVPGPLAPGGTATLFYTSAVPVAVTNLGVVVGTPSDDLGTPITNLPPVRDDDDAIVQLFASLGDFVWLDVNADGVQDGGSETGIPGVVVTLYDATTNALGVTTTALNGAYAFTNLLPGSYFVGFGTVSGHALSPQDQSGNDALDSDASPLTRFTVLTVLESGENDPTWDAGFYELARLGDFVWNDLDADGVQSPGETGIVGVVVRLYDTNDVVVGTTTTDVNGAYAFTNLVPGGYSVGFTTPAGYYVSPQDQGADGLDSDVNAGTGRTIETTLVSGENDPTWDAGFYRPASLGNFAWLDVNWNGVQDGVSETGMPGVVVTLYDATTNALGVTTTDVNGAYAFTNLTPGTYFVGFATPATYELTQRDAGGNDALDSDADLVTGYSALTTLISGEDDPTLDAGVYQRASLGDFVWNDLDADGVQDGGETGIVGVVVRLYDTNSVVVGTTTTDVNGAYAFTNLVPGGYSVGFTTPAGYYVSPQDQGADGLDSDVNAGTGLTIETTLVSGENDPTWDAGFYLPASLGNFVWLDVNWNGVQDGGSETGMPGVAVTLYDAQTNALGVTTTALNGAYAFTNLVPGTYFVGFTPLATYELTQQDAGGDDATDSDASLLTGYTIPTVLISGENDPTWDAGVFQRASLGDFVWNDLNADGIQQVGETGVVSVVVNLLATNGTLLASTTTDVNGAYAFTNLPPGEYVVDFVTPAGSVISPPNQGGDDTADSDADIVTGQSGVITLVSGENDPTIDAGLYIPASLGDFVWNDLDADGVQDGGETGVVNVVVNLYDTNNVVVGTTTTDVSGAYAFTNLVPGTYYVGFVAPGGYVVSPQDQGGNEGLDSDANTLTGLTIATTLVSGENDPTWDAGLYLPASLGNFVWLDANWNGVQDGGSETGMPGVVVTLYDATTNALGVTTTALNGAYAFTNLVPGTYFVGFTPLATYELTQQDLGGDDALDSDASPLTGHTIPTVLISGEDDPTWDAGVYQRASLGDFVWNDLNADGVQNGGETGIVNVVVRLYDSTDMVIATTTTDVNGAYAFTNLVPATYYVGFTPPGGWAASPQDQGGNDGLDSDASALTGLTIPTTLVSGENDPTWDAGFYLPASLGDFVWLDANWNGVQDGGSETGMPGVVVTLYGPTTNVLGVTTTALNGAYAFTNLVPGTYFVGFTPLATYELTQQDLGGDDALDSDASLLTGHTIPTVLISGENDPTWDAGVFQRASLGDFVWSDDNRNGQQDGGSETGMPGVVVNLLATNGTLLASTTTDVNGAYAFTNLAPGEYVVEFEPPTDYEITTQNSGSDLTDSDADPFTGRSGVVVLESGENDPTVDAGVFTRASIGNLVWLDVNANGLQDGGAETGMPGVVVRLYDVATNVVGTTTTDVSGAYAFTNLTPGTYFVGFGALPGYFVSPLDQGGDDALDSDINSVTGWTAPTQLTGGENDLSWDMGVYQPASLGDFVWLDVNWNGIQDGGAETGMPGVVVTLYGPITNVLGVTTTAVNGAYAFTNLVPGTYFVGFAPLATYELTQQDLGGDDAIDSDANISTGYSATTTLVSGQNDPTLDAGVFQRASLGNFVWNDLNANGVQDGGETGVVDVVVNLLATNGTLLASTTTDVNGAYAFTNLPPGDYVVDVLPPAGSVISTQDQGGNDATDSDADVTTGQSGVVTLESGENDPTTDAGLYLPASLGNFVWNDLNADGVQDGGETGIVNVVVRLYDTNNVVVGTTTTDVSGAYAFTNLVPATYYVGFTPPAGWAVSPQDQAGNDGLDSDAHPLTGFTIATTLISGENDPTWDAGLYLPASLGNFVWLDVNWNGVQDGSAETGMTGVVVNLYDASDVLIGTTTTDVSGAYAFTNLVPATYYVGFLSPLTYELTQQNLGGDDATDSDASVVTGYSDTTTLLSGQNDPTLDAGVYQRASLGDFVWNDLDADGVQDGSETGIVNVVVRLYDSTDTVIATTTTDVSGAYAFTNLVPANYYVGFTPPAGWAASPQDQGGDDGLDSDGSVLTGLSVTTTLISGENDPTWDAGFYLPASLGDFVWLDANWNGVQDGGSETGMPGVVVTLYGPTTNVLGVTTTAVNGAYAFTNLVPGTYFVGFTPLATYELTQQDLGGNDSLDSDANLLTGYSATTTLISGQNDPTLDAGVFQRASLGDVVWYDFDRDGIQTMGETGVVGVVVTLYDAQTNAMGVTTTGVSGAYAFTNLLPGTYFVGFDTNTLPLAYGITFQDEGGSDLQDSDANEGTGFTAQTTLVSGENDPSWDAGIKLNAVGYTLDKTNVQPGPATVARVGEGITFTITVVNTGAVDLVTVPVDDVYEQAYLLFTSAIPAQTLSSPGLISWADVGPLPVGASTTLVVNFAAVGSSLANDRTNVVVTSPTTPVDEPPVPVLTNDAPYATITAGYTLDKTLISSTNRLLFWEETVVFELKLVNTGETDLVSVDLEDRYDSAVLNFLSATPGQDQYAPGLLNWTNLGPVVSGASTSIFVRYQVAVNTFGVEYTNVVVATPTTSTNRPPVPVLTNDEPYASTSGSFGDTVWVDVNGDGSPTNENLALFGLNGVVVDLYRIQGGVTSLYASVSTTNVPGGSSDRGFYLFTNLPYGVYVGVVNVGTVPPSLTVPTTALVIPGTIGPDSSFQAADFGFLNASATPVELLYFNATPFESAIRLTWETALEINSLGYRLYRAESGAESERLPLSSDIIPGQGADHGAAYERTDSDVVAGTDYIYWLEEVGTDGASEWYGPVRVRAGVVTLGEHIAGTLLSTGGLVRVSADDLAAVGMPMGQVDPANVQVLLGGQEVARFVSAEQSVLRSGDYLLFYAPPVTGSCEVAIRLVQTNAMDMAWTYARPRAGAGSVGLASVGEPGVARFAVDPQHVRTLVSGFQQSSIWALDVTDPAHPSLLYGYNVVPRPGSGEYAIYLSLATNVVVDVIAVQNDRVQDLQDLERE